MPDGGTVADFGLADNTGSLRLYKDDWAIDCEHPGRDHLSLERSIEVVYRRPIGVIIGDAQPQRGIPCIAGQRSRDVVSLQSVGLDAEA